MNNLILSNKSGTEILFFVLFTVLALGLIAFLVWRTTVERRRFAAKKIMGDTMTKEFFDTFLDRKLKSTTKKTNFTIYYVELNDAKRLQTTFGDSQYTTAIKEIVDRFTKIVPAGSKISTYKYDAIVVYIEGDLSDKQKSDYAGFMIMAANEPIALVSETMIEIDVNIGVVSYDAFNKDADSIWSNLEFALVTAKRSNVNQYAVYSISLSAQQSDEYKYYQEIKEAIENNEFTLYYQPIINTGDNTTFGYEALIRWNHKTLGVLSPNKFLHIMEQSGDINWVGTWTFEQLLLQYTKWKRMSPNKKLVMSINLLPKQLLNDNLFDNFKQILKRYKVDPSEICMEVSEFALFDKVANIRENVQKLQQAGLLIAIDNYGLDLNTLTILQKTHVDIIKLDREFVKQGQENSLNTGIINMLLSYARENNVKLVAMGIETVDMLDYVKGLGVELCQGYYFSKPMEPANFQ